MGRDKSLKIWQYSGDQRQLQSFEFASFEYTKQEMPFDIHPLSCQVAIGMKGLKIYFIVEGELVVAYENFEKVCYSLAYTSRGHLLAVGFESEILLLDPYSFEIVVRKKNHTGMVKSLQWVANDRYLVSLCSASSVFVWDVWDDYKPLIDDARVGRNCKVTAVAYDAELDLLVFCCTDGYLRVYRQQGLDLCDEFQVDNSEGVIFTSVLISKRLQVVIFGTNKGTVRIYLWPLLK